MPGKFKRRFSRKFVRRGNAFKGKRMRFSGVGTKTLNVIKRHAPTIMRFAQAYFCRQPMPDRFETVMMYDNFGNIAAGASSNSFGFSISTPFAPLNKPGSVPSKLTNPFVALASASAAGLRNLVFNAGTSSGLYQAGFVLGVRVEVTVMPQSAGDSVVVAMAPIGPTGSGAYGNVVTCGQGPNSVMKVCEFSVPGSANTLSNYYSLPALRGLSKTDYLTDTTNNSFSAAADPLASFFVQVFINTADNVVSVSPITITVRMAFNVRLFNRVDAALIDN